MYINKNVDLFQQMFTKAYFNVWTVGIPMTYCKNSCLISKVINRKI